MESPPTKALCAFLSEAIEMLPPTFYREYVAGCLNDIPLSPLPFDDYPSHALLFPYTKEYVPCSPLSYLDTGILFYTGKKQNKEIRSFFFFNVSSFDWLCHLGIWKTDFPAES